MLVNSVNGTIQVNSQEGITNPKTAASSARNVSAIPEDTVTLSPAAQAMQTEQKLAAAAAENALSPAAEALQAEQKLAAAAAKSGLSPAAQALQTEEKLAAAAAAENTLSPAAEATATLWRSALALINE